jgi:hypothetical protein
MKRKRELLPRWNMPSDPVKAVFWFLHWFLQVLVRFFYIPILLAALYESYINIHVSGVLNGIVAGIITMLVGIGVWLGLGLLLLFIKVSTGLSKGLSELNRMQQGLPPRRPFYSFMEPERESNVVEGSVTDLDEERRKRRPE